MTTKEPVLLTVLIETGNLRWFVAGIDLNGQPLPLVRSEVGNLSPYLGAPLDEQVSFLRHRLSGVLQRGCDRLWGRQQKPCLIVFVTDGPFAQAVAELTQAVADHFVEWLNSPPVVFFTSTAGWDADPASLTRLAGELDAAYAEPFRKGLPALGRALQEPDLWELAPPKPRV
jgi:hypothetical protein